MWSRPYHQTSVLDSLTLYKDGWHDSFAKVRPEHLDHFLVAACSIGYKSCRLCVSRQNKGQTKNSSPKMQNPCSPISGGSYRSILLPIGFKYSTIHSSRDVWVSTYFWQYSVAVLISTVSEHLHHLWGVWGFCRVSFYIMIIQYI